MGFKTVRSINSYMGIVSERDDIEQSEALEANSEPVEQHDKMHDNKDDRRLSSYFVITKDSDYLQHNRKT